MEEPGTSINHGKYRRIYIPRRNRNQCDIHTWCRVQRTVEPEVSRNQVYHIATCKNTYVTLAGVPRVPVLPAYMAFLIYLVMIPRTSYRAELARQVSFPAKLQQNIGISHRICIFYSRILVSINQLARFRLRFFSLRLSSLKLVVCWSGGCILCSF
jgi:hypothetical protein